MRVWLLAAAMPLFVVTPSAALACAWGVPAQTGAREEVLVCPDGQGVLEIVERRPLGDADLVPNYAPRADVAHQPRADVTHRPTRSDWAAPADYPTPQLEIVDQVLPPEGFVAVVIPRLDFIDRQIFVRTRRLGVDFDLVFARE